MYKKLLILTTFLTLIAGVSEAAIINVPDDEETIQAGMDAADRGDTVLVQPGRYEENIEFSGSDIVVASLYLTTGDADFIESTIIEGDEEGSIVIMNGGVNSILDGFTITGGNGQYGGGIYSRQNDATLRNLIVEGNTARYGGGIYIIFSESTLENVIVRNNEGSGFGGGIYLQQTNISLSNCLIDNNASDGVGGGMLITSSSPILIDVTIQNNSTGVIGGGIRLDHSDPTLIRVAVIDNFAEQRGGGIAINHSSNPIMVNVTVAGNEAGARDGGGGIYITQSEGTMVNCIVWHNEPPEIDNSELIEATFSDFEVALEGEGNIDDDPLFVDPENGDYNLTDESPCYNTGDPNGDFDPDGSRADMGAFSIFKTGSLNGYVLDLEDEQPLEGATVITQHGMSARTNEEGYWQILHPLMEVPFDLTVSMIGYLDSTLIELEMEEDDTLSIDVSLLHAELEPSIEGLATEIEIGEEEQFEFNISNPGNGPLRWYGDIRYRGDAGRDPWELRQSYGFGEQLEDDRLYGVVFIDSLFYIAGANDGDPAIYILNIEGELINTFAQPGDDNRGIKDLTYDGELIWGTVDRVVYGMTLAGEVVQSFEIPINGTPITWDPDRELLWICTVISDIHGYDREGNRVDGMDIDRDDMRIYGLSYFADDVDESPIYIFSKDADNDRQTLHKHNFETDENIFVAYLEPEAGGNPRGSFITNRFDNYSWVFMSIADQGGDDRVDIWQLESILSWVTFDPVEGIVNPASEQAITLNIDTGDLAMIEYPTELIFTHNGFGLETIIPITLIVTPLGINDQTGNPLPVDFAISNVFPNPFNSTVKLQFTVPQLSNVSLKLYDLRGTFVEEIASGVYHSGQHTIIWNASTMPSGLYFARMEANGIKHTAKLMLMK